MSNAAGAHSNGANTGLKSPDSKAKGKGKSAVASPDVSMEDEEDEDEDEDEDDDAMEEDEDEGDEEEEEEYPDIDPSQILGRRTRGVKVDYTSKEALEKAGLKPEGDEDEDDEMTEEGKRKKDQ